ncbi:MAG: hypothetical protein CVV23_14625 [Ignavibacteriae bacterium HGW-Ignavibacteriae-2]|jgi:Fe2+ or Zn2+ uptake regulation protein|nr:MAG: hypothetical protein CVV23_14625 [Ignavibacteriae bacterium HGW-Ignavibacteriae-2]
MEKYLNTLRAEGYKITGNRKEVLQILLDNRKPLTLKDIHRLCANIDFATIYRMINVFVDLGIVYEVKLLEKQIHYELMDADDHHHHIICKNCGKIARIDLCVVNTAKKLTDFQITNHTLEFKGLCPQCKK